MRVEDLILVQWSCVISQEKVESFIQFVEEKLKPFYELHGCKRFELFMAMETDKKYFPFQVAQEKTRYTEQVTFSDIKDFEKVFEDVKRDKYSRELMESYSKIFNVSSCSFIILRQKV